MDTLKIRVIMEYEYRRGSNAAQAARNINDVYGGFSTANKTWLPVAEGYETLNVEVQKAADRSHLKVYQTLVHLRQDKVFRYGYYESLAMNEGVFVFRRWYGRDIYLVVVNMRNTDYQVDLRYFDNVYGKANVVLSSINSPKNEGDTVSVTALPVMAYEGLVLKLQ